MAIKSTLRSLIGASPFSALQKHMREVMACVREVPPLFEAVAAQDSEKVLELKELIFEREEAADQIKNELRGALPKSLFMPVDRRDLLDVLSMQDSIADTAQDIAGLLVEREMTVPDGLEEPVIALANRCVGVCEQSALIIEELDELLTVGFRGREATSVEAMVVELNRLETETDELGLELARKLFAIEDDLNPISVMMWYRLIEWIGDLADYAEKAGDRLRLLIAR